MDNYPVPQFIEEEGKIVFFLTFRQFFLLVGGGATCFLIFFTLPFLVFVILSVLIMGLVLMVAFVKINGIPILKVLLNFTGFLIGTKNYTWQKIDVAELRGNLRGTMQKNENIQVVKSGTSIPVDNNPIATTPISKLERLRRGMETRK